MGLTYSLKNQPFPTPPADRALNPLGTVPHLEDDAGVGLSESIALLLCLARDLRADPVTADGPSRPVRPLPAWRCSARRNWA
jgi:glutathione S-transferase